MARHLIHRALRIGAVAGDDADLALEKSVLVGAAVFGGIPVQIILGALLFTFGETLVGGLLIGFAAVMVVGIPIVAAWPSTFPWVRFGWLLVPLVSPFTAALLLGGIGPSGFSVLWAFLTPLLALATNRPRQAIGWFVAFVALMAVTAALEPYLRPTNLLPRPVLTALAFANATGLAAVAFAALLAFTTQRERAFRWARDEQSRSEALLLNILPRQIADILKSENRIIADHFESASVLFADVVNFTQLSARLTPIELVQLLNEVFSTFDALVDRYGVEKIKTIGDCYMVASGIPVPRADHAHALLRLALDIQDHVERHTIRGQRLSLRIGVNSGAVAAGVIGRRKFIYDLWGDAVNTASRMESQGRGGAIQITTSTYELVRDTFVCQPGGVISVKGKGELPVWHVLAERRGNDPDA